MDPVGFEPTVSSVQRRRLPTRPRAHASGRYLVGPQVPTRGLEPPRPCGQQILSLPRLPIPPRRQESEPHGACRWYSRFCFKTVICLSSIGCWRLLTCRVLPDFAVAAAARSNPGTNPSRTHPPCSRLHARPAGPVTGNRWWALTPPFHPSPEGILPAGLLSVAVVVTCELPHRRPHLLFREATLPQRTGLGVGKFLCTGFPAQRRSHDRLKFLKISASKRFAL